MMLVAMFAAMGCDRPAQAGPNLPEPTVDLPAPPDGRPATVVLAGGCFWCVEGVFEQLDGVLDAVSGYCGGAAETANYKAVCTGTTGHAEAVRITYDPAKISFGRLLQVFFATHDPTTLNRQGPDEGTQYRSAIFYADEDQKRVAEAYIRQLAEARVFDRPIVTTLEKLEAFHPAEDYHQDYAACNPQQPYIRQVAMPKIQKVRQKFADQVKPATRPSR